MSTRAQVGGIKRLRSQVQDLTTKQRRTALRVGLRAGANLVAKDAKSRVRVNTAKLRDAIKFNVKVGKNSEGAEIGYERKTFYGLFQEVGTRFMRAQPFLRPALVAKQAAAVAKFADVFSAMVRKYRG